MSHYSKNIDKIKVQIRKAGNAYLKHREYVDPALIAHAGSTAILKAAASKIAISALTVKLAPIALAAVGAYYGPEICRRTRDFLADTQLSQPKLLLAPVRISSNEQFNHFKPR